MQMAKLRNEIEGLRWRIHYLSNFIDALRSGVPEEPAPLADVHDPPGLEAHESRRRQPGRRRVQSYAEIAECR